MKKKFKKRWNVIGNRFVIMGINFEVFPDAYVIHDRLDATEVELTVSPEYKDGILFFLEFPFFETNEEVESLFSFAMRRNKDSDKFALLVDETTGDISLKYFWIVKSNKMINAHIESVIHEMFECARDILFVLSDWECGDFESSDGDNRCIQSEVSESLSANKKPDADKDTAINELKLKLAADLFFYGLLMNYKSKKVTKVMAILEIEPDFVMRGLEQMMPDE